MSGVRAGNAQVYLFQNYALLQRPPDSCLKALDKFAWQSFGLEAEVLYMIAMHNKLPVVNTFGYSQSCHVVLQLSTHACMLTRSVDSHCIVRGSALSFVVCYQVVMPSHAAKHNYRYVFSLFLRSLLFASNSPIAFVAPDMIPTYLCI